MDGERILDFIAFIQEHSALWKKEDKDFINRDVRRRLLCEIGEKMGMTEEECRKKLKNLKDKMREICNKLPKTANGQPAFHKGEKYIRWPYYKALLFMKDQFINRDTADDFQTGSGAAEDEDNKDSLSTGFDPLPMKERLADLDRLFSSQSETPERQRRKRTSRILNQKTRTSKFIKSHSPDLDFDIETNKGTSGLALRKEVSTEQSQSRKPIDEWGAFAESISHDLRKITNPYLIVSVKNDINRLVGETVIRQLNMSSQVSQCSRFEDGGIVIAESTGQLPSTSMPEFKTEEF